MTLKDSIKQMLMDRYSAELDRRGATGGLRIPVSDLSESSMAGLTVRTKMFGTGDFSVLRNKLQARSRAAQSRAQSAAFGPQRNKFVEEAAAPTATKADLMALAEPALEAVAQNMASASQLQIAAWREGKAGPELWDEMVRSGAMIPGAGNQEFASVMKQLKTTGGTPINVPTSMLAVAEGDRLSINGFREAGDFAGDIDEGVEGFGSDLYEGAEGFGRKDNFGVDVNDMAIAVDVDSGGVAFGSDVDEGAGAFGGDIDNGARAFGEDIDSGASSFGKNLGLVGMGTDLDRGAVAFGGDIDEAGIAFSGDIDEGARAFGEDIDSGASTFGSRIGLLGLGATPGEDDLDSFGDEETDAFFAHEDTLWNFNELKDADQPAATAATVNVAKKGIQEALRTLADGKGMAEVKYRLGRMGIKPPGFFSAPRLAGEKAYLEIMRSLAENGYVDLLGNAVKKPKVAPAFQRMRRFGLFREIG